MPGIEQNKTDDVNIVVTSSMDSVGINYWPLC